ncbi:hypothetical protein V5O48_000584, partial [Marasmius crinis-equi]
MRFSASLLTLATAVVLASAQNIPTCALTCISGGNTGGCSSTDTKCLCTNQDFINSAVACINKNCQGSDVDAARNTAEQLCSTAGVSLTIPSGSATSGSSTGSGTATSASQTPT